METKPGLTQLMEPLAVPFFDIQVKVHPFTYLDLFVELSSGRIKAFRRCARKEPDALISPLMHPVIQDELYKMREEIIDHDGIVNGVDAQP